jgi:hypothetical protein
MALTDYSKMEGEITNAPEPTALKKGMEVKARIIGVRIGIVDKAESDYDGISYFSVSFDAPDEPLAKEFSDFFWDLCDREKIKKVSEKAELTAMRKFRNFADAFGLDYSRPFDLEDDLPGKTGWLIVGIKKSDEYGDQNTVQKYLAPNAGSGKVGGSAPVQSGAPF